jgi:hypothetical protein
MSRATVRAAIVAYLLANSSNPTYGNGNIAFLNDVFGFPLKYTPEPTFYDPTAPTRTDGAIIWCFFPGQNEVRTAFGGPPGDLQGGEKKRVFTLNMDIIFKSSEPDTQVVGANNEQFLDDLVEAIEADRNAGAPSVIYQWGEGAVNKGEVDIRVTSDYPMPIEGFEGAAVVYSKVVVTVVEFLEQT